MWMDWSEREHEMWIKHKAGKTSPTMFDWSQSNTVSGLQAAFYYLFVCIYITECNTPEKKKDKKSYIHSSFFLTVREVDTQGHKVKVTVSFPFISTDSNVNVFNTALMHSPPILSSFYSWLQGYEPQPLSLVTTVRKN